MGKIELINKLGAEARIHEHQLMTAIKWALEDLGKFCCESSKNSNYVKIKKRRFEKVIDELERVI